MLTKIKRIHKGDLLFDETTLWRVTMVQKHSYMVERVAAAPEYQDGWLRWGKGDDAHKTPNWKKVKLPSQIKIGKDVRSGRLYVSRKSEAAVAASLVPNRKAFDQMVAAWVEHVEPIKAARSAFFTALAAQKKATLAVLQAEQEEPVLTSGEKGP